MMKYLDDARYWPIDTSTQDPNFRAQQGSLDESLMVASVPATLNEDYSTNANNR